jgi:carboxypeptidase C (cathepsin A)
VGYSFARSKLDQIYTDHSQSVDTFAALRNFYSDWPELLKNDLYISGESYGGIYAPFLAMQIHQWNEELAASQKSGLTPNRVSYPLVGFIVGNGATDWEFDGTVS